MPLPPLIATLPLLPLFAIIFDADADLPDDLIIITPLSPPFFRHDAASAFAD